MFTDRYMRLHFSGFEMAYPGLRNSPYRLNTKIDHKIDHTIDHTFILASKGKKCMPIPPGMSQGQKLHKMGSFFHFVTIQEVNHTSN